jgi:hypothetical protein
MKVGQIPGGWVPFLALLLVVGACGDAGPETIQRETFVATYVDLRRAALENPARQITPAKRDEVLSRHGVTEEDLYAFVEAHGRDVDYMAGVWSDVEARLHPQDSAQATPP